MAHIPARDRLTPSPIWADFESPDESFSGKDVAEGKLVMDAIAEFCGEDCSVESVVAIVAAFTLERMKLFVSMLGDRLE